MMQRLIDANNLIQKLRGNVLVDVTTELEKEIENAPTIDPVKHGKWIPNGIDPTNGIVGNWECSECNGVSLKDSDFCPKCGARMDGE